jgi:hypothetical protein
MALKFVTFREVGIVILPGLYNLKSGTLSYMEAIVSGDGMTASPVNFLMFA